MNRQFTPEQRAAYRRLTHAAIAYHRVVQRHSAMLDMRIDPMIVENETDSSEYEEKLLMAALQFGHLLVAKSRQSNFVSENTFNDES